MVLAVALDRAPQIDDHGLRPPPAFGLEREPAADGIEVVACRGELDLAAAGPLRRVLDEALAADPRAVVLDLGAVDFLDSTMLKELLRLRRETDEASVLLVLAGLREPLRRLFELTRTEGLFTVAPDRAAAFERTQA